MYTHMHAPRTAAAERVLILLAGRSQTFIEHKRGCRNLQPLLYGESIFSSCHRKLEVLGIGENLLLVGVLFLLPGALDDQRQSQHIDG